MHLILTPEQAFTKYALVKATGIKTRTVTRLIKTLLQLGWVKEYRFSPATYQINLESKAVKHIWEFMHELRHIGKGNPS